MKFLLTQDHMGLEISKRYFPHSFYLMSVKLYEDIGYCGGIQAVTVLGNRTNFKNSVLLWNFNMGVSGKSKKCGISRRRVIVEWNGQKFATRGSTVHICRVLLMPDSLSLVWGHSVHFAKFPILRFSKRYLPNNFCWIPPQLYENIAYHGEIQAITLLGNRPIFDIIYGTLKF